MIPLGDIDLQHEIRLNELEGLAVVGRRCERGSVRRVYSARIDGRNAPTTVAMYQGPGAEEVRLESVLPWKFASDQPLQEWQQDIAKHMSIQ
jgi:hypothetical protein